MRKYRIRINHPELGQMVQDIFGTNDLDAIERVELAGHWLTGWIKVGRKPWTCQDRLSGIQLTATVRALPR